MRFTAISIVVVLTAGVAVARGPDRRPLAAVDFFGYKGVDVAAIRRALPFQQGDSFPPPKVHTDELKRQVAAAIKKVIGREPTDVAFICCDAKQDYLAYIGLPGESYEPLAFNPTPTGDAHLAKDAVKLSEAMDDAWSNAILNGHATEEDSAGYTLTNDPKARKAELALRDYALQHEDVVLKVLASSSNADHRAIAAQMLGYGRQSDGQIDALVQASMDPDEDVRNNAVRALGVLATARPALARRIPPQPFVRLMRSGAWLDHNKASLILVALTMTREPKLLEELRADALEPLLEMARWRYVGHAEAALTVLGRIAGIEEDSLNKMINAGQTTTILAKFDRR
jgi:HEAT repeats